MKRDCPSLIVEKTQFSLHLLFLICHGVKIAFDCSRSFYFWVSAMLCNMSHFLAIVTSRRWTSGCGFIHIHCVFILYFDCYRLRCAGTCGSIFRFEFPFKGKFFFAVILFGFSVCSLPILEPLCTILGVVLELFHLQDFPFPLFIDLVLSLDRF
jgi:hypothetical protein